MRVIGIKIRDYGQIKYYQTKDNYEINEHVVVLDDQSEFLGTVVTSPKEIADGEEVEKIIRKATKIDLSDFEANLIDEKMIVPIVEQKIIKHKLEMNLLYVEYSLDRKKIIFYFTAEERVDFRSLVKDLASTFNARIELHQIGARDEAKYIGGLGPCGRPLCCSSFLGSFVPVSIRMAKNQNLSLNPTKISGLCGRLMCCLNYEDEEYKEARLLLPDLKERVQTPDGPGVVTDLYLLEQKVQVKLDGFEISTLYDSCDIIFE